jgi:hypothetical protein
MNSKDKIGIVLGATVQDTISGFKGVVVCKSFWLNGCIRITMSPEKLKDDGSPHDNQTFDIEQLKLLKDAPARLTIPSGGPKPEPKQHAQPTR